LSRSPKQSISAITGDWITTIDGRSVRWAIKRRRNFLASVDEVMLSRVERAQVKEKD